MPDPTHGPDTGPDQLQEQAPGATPPSPVVIPGTSVIDRYPVVKFEALDDNDNVIEDLTGYFVNANLSFSDQPVAATAQIVLASSVPGDFDPLGTTSHAALITNNKKFRLQKGFINKTTGAITLNPAFVGRVGESGGTYNRASSETVSISLLDSMKNIVRQTATTKLFQNQQANYIATQILQTFGHFPLSEIAFDNSLDYTFPFVQFPGYNIVDAIQACFDPVLWAYMIDYAGNHTNRRKLGSNTSTLTPILGYPDSVAPPDDSLVAFKYDDAVAVEEVGYRQTDLNGVNQLIVMGQATSDVLVLGPSQELFHIDASSIDYKSNVTLRETFGQGGGNSVVAKNVQVNFYYSTDHTLSPSSPMAVLNKVDQKVNIVNSVSKTVGRVTVKELTSTYITILVQGVGYSTGFFHSTHHGGFDYMLTCFGQPLSVNSNYITAILDYNVQTVERQDISSSDIFGDNVTYQLAKNPIAKGTPVTLFVNPGSLASTMTSVAPVAGNTYVTVASTTNIVVGSNIRLNMTAGANAGYEYEYFTVLDITGSTLTLDKAITLTSGGSNVTVEGITGVVTVDKSELSDQFKVDYDNGRVVTTYKTYQNYSADTNYLNGGTQTNTTAWYLNEIINPAPLSLYQSCRTADGSNYGDIVYQFTGLQVGHTYTIRLHFADPDATAIKQRIFSVTLNGGYIIQDLDLYATVGAGRAYEQDCTGQAPDLSGNMEIRFTVNDPTTAPSYTQDHIHLSSSPDYVSTAVLHPLVSGIEILDESGNAPIAYSINSGGPAINPTPPTVLVSYGWSPDQQVYGIQSKTINNPLLRTYLQCYNNGLYALNYEAWKRNIHTVKIASEPTMYCGQIMKYFNPRLNADLWLYIANLQRYIYRPAPDTPNEGVNPDQDTITGYLLFKRARS